MDLLDHFSAAKNIYLADQPVMELTEIHDREDKKKQGKFKKIP